MKKFFDVNELVNKCKNLKKQDKKIVLSHGVFDLLHIGHIYHFEAAKKNGDFLIVSVTSDKFVNKGSGRPVFNEKLRAKSLSSLNVVDAVVVNDSETSVKIINLLKPDVYFKGSDYKDNKSDRTKNIYKEINAVKNNKGKVLYSNEDTFSSSNIINKKIDFYSEKQKDYINRISKKYSFEYIEKVINSFENINTSVVGETIIDQYYFCNVLGKSGKEPHLVISDEKNEKYLGGAAAVANHTSSFCKAVNFLSIVGQKETQLNFIKKKLYKNINSDFLIKKNCPTILKKRYIDKVSGTKLLGVYTSDDIQEDKKRENLFLKKLKAISKKSQLIIISDYDHGFISAKNAYQITKLKNFVSLNAQVNASNHGYHSLTKYKKINTLLINENELRHEMRNKSEDIRKLSFKIKKRFNITNLVVTRGRKGALMILKNMKRIECPAFTEKVVDKVGAGDAMLSILSLCLYSNVPGDLALFLGSLAGANKVEYMGNSQYLSKKKILRNIEFLLK
jgi:rfaE bifunctional protein kinase chain/domain/rfaE bifunctional protein nucleotidyltransferase chain/domain